MKQSINCDDLKNKDNSECQIADAFLLLLLGLV